MPEHYWRIHARVARRVLLDTPERVRHIIAFDTAHETQEYKWFEKKVSEDAMRLFVDPTYYDNTEYSFRISRSEPVTPNNVVTLPNPVRRKARRGHQELIAA